MRAQKYIESTEFRETMDVTRKHEMIDQEALKYETQEILGLSEERFRNACEAVFEARRDDLTRVSTQPFPEFSIEYKDVTFHLMIGQGSTYWTTTRAA